MILVKTNHPCLRVGRHTRQALSKPEDSSVLMILMVVANAMALLQSHLPDLDVELLRKDFMVNEAEREALTNGAYDDAHEFASSYDFSRLAESEDNDSLRTYNSSHVCCNRYLLI
jgi:hypothetical protein